MKRDLGLVEFVRIIAALEAYADDMYDEAEADRYRALAAEIAGADRAVIVTVGPIE